MAYYELLEDGRTRVHVAKNGLRKSKIFDTKRLAQDWAKRLELSIVEKKVSGKTFRDLSTDYLQKVTPNKRGKEWEERRIGYFLEHFGDTPLDDIDTPEIAQWRDMRLKTVSGSTVVREANILRAMFNVAVDEWRWLERNPFKGLKLPKENAPRQAIWTWQLIKRLLRAKTSGKTREVVEAFHIALRTGMRLQEVLAAPENFDAKRQVVTVKTKGAAQGEEIPVGRIASKLLKRKPFTVSPNEASVLFSKLCRAQMIEGLTFHDARATALTLLAKKVDVFKLARISRHKDINLLHRVYYRTTNDEIARMI